MIGFGGSGAPCSSASKAWSCVIACQPCACSHSICAAKSRGSTVSRRVIAGSVGFSTSIRWYMRIGSVSEREGNGEGSVSVGADAFAGPASAAATTRASPCRRTPPTVALRSVAAAGAVLAEHAEQQPGHVLLVRSVRGVGRVERRERLPLPEHVGRDPRPFRREAVFGPDPRAADGGHPR